MDLVEFLRARLDEDEQVAKAAPLFTVEAHFRDEGPAADTYHDRFTPARVLVEVKAKRRILDEHAAEGGACRTCTTEEREVLWDGEEETVQWVHTSLVVPCTTLRLLALPYADHPDYLPAWKP